MAIFFLTVIKHKGQYFSSITSGEPFKPLKGDAIVFCISKDVENDQALDKLIYTAKAKARCMGISWVSGLDNPPRPRDTPVPYLRLVN